MIEIVIGAPNPRLQIVQSALPNSVPGLIGIFIAGCETTEPCRRTRVYSTARRWRSLHSSSSRRAWGIRAPRGPRSVDGESRASHQRRERYIPKNVFFLREEVLIYDAPSLPRVAWLDGRKNVLFLRWRGERYILHRATGFPYISYILPCRLNSFTRSLKGLYTPHPSTSIP